ncbi:MAG TPA: prenyltransferase [Myxococcota bacterium]|nr:prenyltransferase [Myxococcota bacterium]HRY97278.1 prenyltransferase [Myxococcota bacterium]
MAQWIQILRTCNPEVSQPLGPVSKWLVITRACVFSMTVLSAGIGGLLAALAGAFDPWAFGLVVVGLVLAHASNNMVNDYFDVRHGVDTPEYPRAAYAPHPILSGMISVRGLWVAIFVFNLLDLGIALALTWWKGWPVLAFAAGGLAVSVFYVAPPFKLKHHGLGELAIFAIWGPLMVSGSYYALAGALPGSVWLASVPYGLAVMAVVVGKHLDKREKDAERRVGTLPVLLGERGGKRLMGALIVLLYLCVLGLAVARSLPLASLLVLLSLPRAVRVLRVLALPMPTSPQAAFALAKDAVPRDLREKFDPARGGQSFPLWPLWYVVWGVWWVRVAGAWLVVGLALGLAEPWLLLKLGLA